MNTYSMDIVFIGKEYSGDWIGENTLHDPMSMKDVISNSTASITAVANGKFIRLDYNWSRNEEMIEGSILLGYKPTNNTYMACWIDSWHMGNDMMVLHGIEKKRIIALNGKYKVENSVDWGWKILLVLNKPEKVNIQMLNISPENEEFPAVEIDYEREGER